MSCCCKTRIIPATSVTASNGAVTITVPATTEFLDGNLYKIGLFTSAIPDGTDNATISITNGTTTAFVMNDLANYFRRPPLRGRTVLTLRYFGDPSHFLAWGC